MTKKVSRNRTIKTCLLIHISVLKYIILYKGSFIHSSNNIRIENNILYADLRKIDGSYNSTSIEFNPNIEYDNIDGNFNISHNNIKMLNITMNLSEQSVDKELFSGTLV